MCEIYSMRQGGKKNVLRLPFKGVLALCSKEVHVGLELQLKDVLLVNAVGLLRCADRVAQQGETSQGKVILEKQ